MSVLKKTANPKVENGNMTGKGPGLASIGVEKPGKFVQNGELLYSRIKQTYFHQEIIKNQLLDYFCFCFAVL